MRKALEENRWLSHITPLVTPQEIREYVTLWEEVGHVQLQDNVEDSIRWRWTTDGEYTTKSFYGIQFQGTFSKLKLLTIRKAGGIQVLILCLDIAAQKNPNRQQFDQTKLAK